MPEFPNINSFPDIPEFLKMEGYLNLGDDEEEEIPFEQANGKMLPIELSYDHKQFWWCKWIFYFFDKWDECLMINMWNMPWQWLIR